MRAFHIAMTAALLSAAGAGAASAVPIRTLPNLSSVAVYEVTYVNSQLVFLPSSPSLSRLSDPLSDANSDAWYLSGENYDVFYSDGDGAANPMGGFITIEAVWSDVANFGGSMNIDAVQLSFDNGSPVFADFVSSFVMGSTCPFGCIPGSEALALGAADDVFPRFGGTDPSDLTERMRLTVGFTGISDREPTEPLPTPEPSSLILLGTGVFAAAARARNWQSKRSRSTPVTTS